MQKVNMKNNQLEKNIPNGWQAVKLGDICKVNQGLQIPISERHRESGGKRKLYITTQYLNGKSDAEYIEDFSDGVTCFENDILMTRTGNSGMVITGVEGVFHNNFFKIKPNKNINGKLLVYNLRSPLIQYKLLKLAGASTIPDLNHGDFYSIDILLPPLPEQAQIAAILETWDTSINKLTKVIDIKKNIKRGLIQKLLTGNTRLPGFPDDWKTYYLGDFGTVRTSSVDKLSIEGEEKASLLNYMDVYRRDHIWTDDEFQQVTVKPQQRLSSSLERGDVLFTPSSETQDDIGHSAVVMEDLKSVVFSYHLMRFRPEENYLDYKFSAYCFKTSAFYLELWKKSQGATRYTLSKEALEKSKITIPVSLDEQKRIASILGSVDQEIEILNRKLSIFKDQRKYLLTSLITGAIRVPEHLRTKGVISC